MTRLYVLVEGQTEERFAKSVLEPHLARFDVASTPIVVHTGLHPDGSVAKGGGRWRAWRNHLSRLAGQHARNDVRFTSLLDLYGFPSDFPGYAAHQTERDTVKRSRDLEAAMAKEIGDWRFIPYVQRHEVEALVLVDLDALASRLETPEQRKGLASLRSEVADLPPEDVNDSPETAPSKRLLAHIPGYRKATHGPSVMQDIGLPRLRTACPRFDRWVASLEALGTLPSPPVGAP